MVQHSHFNNLALKRKLAIIVLAIAVPVILVSYSFDLLRELIVQRTEQQMAAQQFVTLVAQMSSNCKTKENVIDLLSSLRADSFPQIMKLELVSSDGMTEYRFESPSADQVQTSKAWMFTKSEEIIARDGSHFKLIMVSSYSYLNFRFWNYMLYAVVISVILLIIVTVISSTLVGRFILTPILSLARIIEQISTNADYSIKLEYHRKDEIGLLYDKFNGLVNTVRLRQEAMHAAVGKLKESELKFRNMADLSPIIMFEANSEGRITFLNRIGLNSFGYTSENLAAGLNITELVKSKNETQLPLLDFSEEQEMQVRAIHAMGIRSSGKEFNVNAFLSPIFKNSTFYGIRGVIIDITERMVMIDNLRKAKLDAEKSDNLKSAFLANMSHEIRTPMNSIIGFADMLTDKDLTPEEREEFICYINNSGKVLLNLIDDIIDIAKIEAGQIQIVRTEFGLNGLLEELRAFAQNECKRLNKPELEIRVCKSGDDSLMVSSDPFRLRQIMTNLIVNAVKFTDEGFIEFGYTLERQEGAGHIRLYVRDTGIGIPEDKQNEIFDRFVKLANSKQRLYGGTGLGLAISRRIADLMGCTITVRSTEGAGSVFSVTLPATLPPIQEITVTETPKVLKKMEIDWSEKTILVAEDEETNYSFIKAALRRTGAQIIWVQNGKLAVEECISNPSINLVLMDMKMPIMNGFDATREIRSQLPNHMPIIAQTAFAMAGEREKSIEAGCDGYLSKPIKPKELIELISQIIR